MLRDRKYNLVRGPVLDRKMKQAIIKLDRLILDQLTSYIKKWIEKKEFKKNRVDFLILTEWVDFGAIVLWATILPVVMFIVEGDFIQAGVQAFIWSILSAIEYVHIQRLILQLKPIYDRWFSMRKNPDFYRMQKEVLEELFEKSRRERLGLHALALGTGGFFSCIIFVMSMVTDDVAHQFMAEFILFNAVMSVLQSYIHYVFDFDPPERKEKKAKESMTELMARAWRELVEGFAPVPNYG